MSINLGDLLYDGQTLGMVIEIKNNNLIVEWFASKASTENYHEISANWRLQYWRQKALDLYNETKDR